MTRAHIAAFIFSTVLLSLVVDGATVGQVPRQLDHAHPDTDMGQDSGSMHDAVSITSKITEPMAEATSKPTSTMSAMTGPPDPHGHNHGSHQAAKEMLDDAAIHVWHHFPPTYLAADFRLDNDSAIFGEEFDSEWDPSDANGHKTLMVFHVLGMTVAYFVALPVALALRAADHPSHYLANTAFLVTALLGWLAGAAYTAATPERYENNKHTSFGNVLLLLSIGLAVLDSLGLISRSIALWRSGERSWSAFVNEVLRGNKTWLKPDSPSHRYEMLGLVEHEERTQSPAVMFSIGDCDEEEDTEHHDPESHATRPRPSTLSRTWSPPSRNSTGSDGTLHDPPVSATSVHFDPKIHSRRGAFDRERRLSEESIPEQKMTARRFGEIVLTWLRRVQVVFAYVVFLTGSVVYVGMCRGSFINSCAAHFIKGSIFFGYGVLTFARYLGAYADLGWAWNRRPDGKRGPSAEMVECAVIFVYGATNTWMERFGAAPGSSYTIRQVQHISIAVMFWFAGLTGILLESRTVRRVLSTVAGHRSDNEAPPSYAFSFNPLPALVIAVTGLAMSAHHQEYVFQVAIHELWGILLAGGSLFRFLTYFFLWIRPPVESTLPSRPPTEVLTSFGWAAGGLVFMLSNEEIAYASMRAGYDDMMAFLNITIAVISLTFCWEVVVMAIKGTALSRLQAKIPGLRHEDEERA